jgi:hypothetical protein
MSAAKAGLLVHRAARKPYGIMGEKKKKKKTKVVLTWLWLHPRVLTALIPEF